MAVIALHRHRLMAVPPLGAHADLGGVGEAPGARAERGYHGLPMHHQLQVVGTVSSVGMSGRVLATVSLLNLRGVAIFSLAGIPLGRPT